MTKLLIATSLGIAMLLGYYPNENREASTHTKNKNAVATCYGEHLVLPARTAAPVNIAAAAASAKSHPTPIKAKRLQVITTVANAKPPRRKEQDAKVLQRVEGIAGSMGNSEKVI